MTEIQKIEEYAKEEDFENIEKFGRYSKLKRFLESSYFIAVCVVFVAVISFSLGRVSRIREQREPVKIIKESVGEVKGVSVEEVVSVPASSDAVIGSKNSTKYHYPWCAGAKQIADKNKITFTSIEEARAKGYTPASNCKGLK